MAGREDWQARCLREKRARKRRARGSDSETSVLRRDRIVGSMTGEGDADRDVAEGAILGFRFVEAMDLESFPTWVLSSTYSGIRIMLMSLVVAMCI